jgi:DNA repair protein RadC
MISLNRANKVIGYYKVSKGGMTGTIADPKVIFTMALNSGATSIIVAHNHPSGNLQPSPQDKQITSKLINAGKLLDINVFDHIILTSNSYYSFLDEGQMI